MVKCKNCHHSVSGKFCSNCGQSAKVEDITLGTLVADLPHEIFHVDKGIFYNIIQLFKNPGTAIRDYFAGRRKPFYHPVSFIVIAFVVNYLVVKIINIHLYDQSELLTMKPAEAKAIKDYDAAQWWFLEHTYIYILLAIPASALFLFCIFKLMKEKYNLAQTAVVILFVIAQVVFIQTTIYLCFDWIKNGPFLRAVETVNMCMLIMYATYAIYRLFTPNKIKILRLIVSLIAATGLAFVWIASSYLLYGLLG